MSATEPAVVLVGTGSEKGEVLTGKVAKFEFVETQKVQIQEGG